MDIESLGGGVGAGFLASIIVAVGNAFGFNRRMGKVEDEKQDKSSCLSIHKGNDDKFDAIIKGQDKIWRSVCWSPNLGLFCAVAYTGTGNRVMTSPDGINWTIRASAADNNWRSVCWSPNLGLFCAVAGTGTGNRVMTSLFYKV
jgi:hypothetical protein